MATPPASTEPEASDDIVVTGIRASLREAVDIKRNSQGVVDAISAEDIGKFPDTNLAESLQRVPHGDGLHVRRDAAEVDDTLAALSRFEIRQRRGGEGARALDARRRRVGGGGDGGAGVGRRRH